MSVTPTLLPFQSVGDFTFEPLAHMIRSPGATASWIDVDDVLALLLEVDGVDVPGTGPIDLARNHRVLGADAAGLSRCSVRR